MGPKGLGATQGVELSARSPLTRLDLRPCVTLDKPSTFSVPPNPCPPHSLPHSGALAHSGARPTHLAAAARRGEDLCGCRTCDKNGVWLAQGLTSGWTPPAKTPHLHTCIATSHGLTFPARAHAPLQVLTARRPGCFHRHGKHRTGTLEVGYLGGHLRVKVQQRL